MLTPEQKNWTPLQYFDEYFSRVTPLSQLAVRRVRVAMEELSANGKTMGDLTEADVNEFLKGRTKFRRGLILAVFRTAGIVPTPPEDSLRVLAKPYQSEQGTTAGSSVQAAIRFYGKFLGRTPTLGDLEDELLERFAAWAKTAKTPKGVPWKASTVVFSRQQITLLWTWLYRQKLVANAPSQPAELKEAAKKELGPLAGYFKYLYCRQRELTNHSKRSYLALMRRFDAFTGNKPLGEILPSHVDRFIDSRREKEVRPTALQRQQELLVAVLRHAGRWPEVTRDAEEQAKRGTLLQIAEKEYFPRKTAIRSEQTRYQYRVAIRHFDKHLGRPAILADLNDDTVATWQNAMLQTDKSVNTVRESVARILALWTWLAKRRTVYAFPTIERPKAPEKMPQAFTEEQLRALFKSAAKERGKVCGLQADLWWTSFFAVCWNTAERKSALLACRLEWFDLDKGTLCIPAEVRKGGRKYGFYTLWGPTVELLRKFFRDDPTRELAWPQDKCHGSYYTAFNRILKDAGIPVSRKFKTHAIRVSHASHLCAAGGDATKKLGHSDTATTQKHYLDPRMIPHEEVQLIIPWA